LGFIIEADSVVIEYFKIRKCSDMVCESRVKADKGHWRLPLLRNTTVVNTVRGNSINSDREEQRSRLLVAIRATVGGPFSLVRTEGEEDQTRTDRKPV
jgi:hypothetical protein